MGVVAIISIIYVPMHLHIDDGDDCNEPFSLITAMQILTTEPLDKWLKKSYNTTTLVGRFGDKTTTTVGHKSLK